MPTIPEQFIEFVHSARTHLPSPNHAPSPVEVVMDRSIEYETTIRKAWDQAADTYPFTETDEALALSMTALLESTRMPTSPERWLSLGSGPGLYEIFLLRQFPDLVIDSLDIAPQFINMQRLLASIYLDDPSQLITQVGSMSALQYPSRNFDMVLSINSLHWTNRWRETLQEIHRVSKYDPQIQLFIIMGAAPLLRGGTRVITAENNINTDNLMDGIESQGFMVDNLGELNIAQGQFGTPTKRLSVHASRHSGHKNKWPYRMRTGRLPFARYSLTPNGIQQEQIVMPPTR